MITYKQNNIYKYKLFFNAFIIDADSLADINKFCKYIKLI